MLGAQLRERHHPRADGAVAGAELLRLWGDVLHGGGKSVKPVDHMKVDLAVLATDKPADRGVARAQSCVKISEFGLRLDHDAAPPALIEPERHVVGDRMAGAISQ
jgi:hypothetical protein